MAVSFSAAADSCAEGLTDVGLFEVLAAGFAAAGFAETEAAGPLADRLASGEPERRVGGEAVAPVAARVGVGTAFPTAATLPLADTAPGAAFAACAAPAAGSDAFVLLVVTAVILAL